jgi:DNA mismatch repair ATPase MutS
MSGKTVAMKTVVCLQALTQLGFFVPAKRFRTELFGKICVIGGGGAEYARGLSSFALEMLELHRAVVNPNRPKLYVADEFARTTNSREAKALITGLLSGLDASDSAYSLIATHYLSIEEFPTVRRYRMRGLDWPAIHRAVEAGNVDLSERVKIINRCVTYELIREEAQNPTYDALAIAELLGVDASIIDVARQCVGRTGTPEPEPT